MPSSRLVASCVNTLIRFLGNGPSCYTHKVPRLLFLAGLLLTRLVARLPTRSMEMKERLLFDGYRKSNIDAPAIAIHKPTR